MRQKRIPMPKTINWLSYYGSWENLCAAITRSIGGTLGSGVMKSSKDFMRDPKEAGNSGTCFKTKS